MRRTLRARTPIIALAFLGIAALFIAACTTDEVTIPDLTGPSGARLFITMEASPDKVFIKGPNANPATSQFTIQLKNQLGEGVPNARIALRIVNANGSEVAIGSLDHVTVTTDSAGFARFTYTAPSTAQQPVPVQVFVRAILTDPAFAFEVVSTHQLDLELRKEVDCVAGPGSPTISFSFTPNNPIEDQEVCFDAQATSGTAAIISFTWDFGDGGTDSGSIACHTFRSEGPFPVTLFVVDANQNCVSFTQIVTVGESGAPVCSFTASPNPVNTDTNVLFNASASNDPDGQITGFRWNFGDGATANGEQVTHQFAEQGTYTVILVVTDNSGNETTCTSTVTVTSGLPLCQFTVSPAAPNTGDVVTFDASGSSDIDGGTLDFEWDFGDGNTGDGQVVTHTFTSEDTFLVTLTVTDDEGNPATCSESVNVGSVPPTCAFTASPTSVSVGTPVNFNATTSTDDGTITNFAFDFGDGTAPLDPNTDPTVSHTFTSNGSFIVTLTLTDNDGNTTSCTTTITVGNTLPICSFSATPNSGNPPLAVNFDASASTDQDEGGASIVSFAWDFADGNSETNVTPTTSHTFTQTGTFQVELIVTDDEGGTQTCTRTVTTTGSLPTASFTATPPSGTLDNQGDAITFDATSSTDNDEAGLSIVQYQWDFGDGTAVVTTNSPTTPHIFANPGNFTVTLTVTDDEGQIDTDSQLYVVDADGP